MSWSTIESAIHAWVVAGSGLAGERVVFSGQNHPRPAKPFVTIRLDLSGPIGVPWLAVSNTAGSPAGQEITRTSGSMKTLGVSMQAFSDSAAGAASPQAILGAVANAAGLASVRDALNTANVGVNSIGSVQRIDGVINSTRFEPRATMQVTCSVPAEVSETGTYIETVEVTNEIADPDETFTVDRS